MQGVNGVPQRVREGRDERLPSPTYVLFLFYVILLMFEPFTKHFFASIRIYLPQDVKVVLHLSNDFNFVFM